MASPTPECDRAMVLLKQGAEAKIYTGTFMGRPAIIKERFTKAYRHPDLDKSLTVRRTKAEVRSIMRCRMIGKFRKLLFHMSYNIAITY